VVTKTWTRTDGPAARQHLAAEFHEHYRQSGVGRAGAVPVISGADPTTLFIGSAISVLKQHVLTRQIPGRGIALAQPAVRAHNARRLLEPGFRFEWGGTFTNIAVLAPHHDPKALLAASLSFFTDRLQVAPADLRIRATEHDQDLLGLSQSVGAHLVHEIDRQPLRYYRHTIGLPHVTGRNINIALRIRDGFRDVGNFILFKDATDGYEFLEVGFGDTTILRSLHNLPHVLDCFPFPEAPKQESPEQERLRRLREDCAAVAVILWREGLRPSSKNASTKILGKYIRALHDSARRSGADLSEVTQAVSQYELLTHGDVQAAPELTEYMHHKSATLTRTIIDQRGRP